MTRARITLAAAGAIAVAALLAGCAGSESTPSFDPTVTTEVPAATTPVESVNWNLPLGEPTSLDPAHSALASNSTVIANLCESLQTQTTSGTVEPGLATSVERTDDQTYVITLRSGVTFWDGQPVTVDDVVYSANRILDPALASPWAAWAGAGATIAATGADEVTVTLAQPDPLVQNIFATPAFAVVQKAYAEEAGADFGTASGGVMCTGPYKLDTWSSGADLTVVKNDAWWNTEAELLVKEVTFSFTGDASAVIAGLRSGSLDGSFSVPVSGFESLGTQGNLLFNHSLGTNWISLVNLEGGLADVKTRQALRALIDYEGISQTVFLGAADPLRAVVPPAAWGYAEDVYRAAWDELPAAEQDLTEAKKLLEESSYDGTEIVLAYPTGIEEQEKMATVIADGAKQIGLNISLKPTQLSDYLNLFGGDPAAFDGIDAFFVIGYLDYPEPAIYYTFFTTSSYYNFAHYSNSEFDAVMADAIVELDDTKRAELVTSAQSILGADMVAVPLVTDYVNVFYSSELAGLVPSPSYLYAPWLATLGGK